MRNKKRVPLVLLDVDGVINDLEALTGTTRPWTTRIVHSHGFNLAVPDYMPELVTALTDACDVHWCTTWRHRANDELAHHLGIGALPVVTDGSSDRNVTWKASAARGLVVEALQAERSVYWIEDFYGSPPVSELPEQVTFIDTTETAPRCVLSPQDLPDSLRAHIGIDDINRYTAARER